MGGEPRRYATRADDPYSTYDPQLRAPAPERMRRSNLLGLSYSALDGDNGYYSQAR